MLDTGFWGAVEAELDTLYKVIKTDDRDKDGWLECVHPQAVFVRLPWTNVRLLLGGQTARSPTTARGSLTVMLAVVLVARMLRQSMSRTSLYQLISGVPRRATRPPALALGRFLPVCLVMPGCRAATMKMPMLMCLRWVTWLAL